MDRPRNIVWRHLRRDPMAVAALALFGLIVLLAMAAPLLAAITGHPADTPDVINGTDANGQPLPPGNHGYIFGSDNLGRDVLVRVAYGARISLAVGLGSTALAVAAGVVAGLVIGFHRGVADALVSRVIEAVLSLPAVLVAIALVSVAGPGIPMEVAVIAFFNWAAIARMVRGQTLAQRELEYVEASRSLGAGSLHLMFREILPNIIDPVIVLAAVLVPVSIMFEAALSYLGLGVPQPAASWGNIIGDANAVSGIGAWWFWLTPSIALLVTTLSLNVLGDALRDALDPGGRRLGPDSDVAA